MLPRAEQITEFEVDHFHIMIFREGNHLFGILRLDVLVGHGVLWILNDAFASWLTFGLLVKTRW